MSPAKKKDILEEIIHLSKAVGASMLIIGLLGSAVWNLKAEDMVDTRVSKGIVKHNNETWPQVEQNAEDILKLKENQEKIKDTQMLTFLSIKQLLSDKQIEEARREHEEIKRRQ